MPGEPPMNEPRTRVEGVLAVEALFAEPRTAAGRRLLDRESLNSRSFPLITAVAIRAIEEEAAAPLRRLLLGDEFRGGLWIAVHYDRDHRSVELGGLWMDECTDEPCPSIRAALGSAARDRVGTEEPGP